MSADSDLRPKPTSDYDFDGSRRALRKADATEMFHLLELVTKGDQLLLNRRRNRLTVTRVNDDESARWMRLEGHGTFYSLCVERDDDGQPVDAYLTWPSGRVAVDAVKVTNRNPFNIRRYDRMLSEEVPHLGAADYRESITGVVRDWETRYEGDALAVVQRCLAAFVQDYRDGGTMGQSDYTLTVFDNALTQHERVRGKDPERDEVVFVGTEMGIVGAALDYAVEDPDIRARLDEATVEAADDLRGGR